ncbi:hypothetical protein ACLOJK_018801, partial [Asimina triloba]
MVTFDLHLDSGRTTIAWILPDFAFCPLLIRSAVDDGGKLLDRRFLCLLATPARCNIAEYGLLLVVHDRLPWWTLEMAGVSLSADAGSYTSLRPREIFDGDLVAELLEGSDQSIGAHRRIGRSGAHRKTHRRQPRIMMVEHYIRCSGGPCGIVHL